MSTEENKALPRRVFEEIYTQGNLAVVEEIYDKNYLNHTLGIKGNESLKQFVTVIRNAFPDLKFTVEDQIAEGDKVATRSILTGTHKGEYKGIAPTGKVVTVTGIVVHIIANGKIIEGWGILDNFGLLQQLGATLPA